MAEVEPKPLPQGADIDALRARVDTALRAEDPVVALIALVRELFADGYDEGPALGALEDSRARLRQQDRETDEDRVMDVMDVLTGWCPPDAILRRDPPLDTPSDRS